MKKNLFYVMSLAAVFSLGSCSQEELADVKQEDGVKLGIESVASTIVQSRYAVETPYLPDKAEIGVFFREDGKTTYESKEYKNIKYKASGTLTQTWDIPAGAPILTDTEGKAYAYYPWKQNNTNIEAIPIDVSDGIVNGFDDIMFSAAPATANWSSNSVNFTMKHLLSIIRVTVERGTYQGNGNPGEADLTRVKLIGGNTATKGTFNLLTQEFTPSDEGDLDLDGGYEGFYDSSITIDIPFIPTDKTVSQWFLQIGVDGKTPSNIAAPWNYQFESGKIYEFYVTVDREYRKSQITQVGVETWVPGNGVNGNTGSITVN